MPSLSFTAPTTVDEAINALARAPGLAKPLAGGTDLLVQMRSGRMRPEVIVDIKRIPDLIGIRETGDSFVIGAATPGVMLSEHEAFSRAWPGIVEGVDLIGSHQIQGRASLVGGGVNVTLDAAGLCTDARVVLGAVAPTQVIVDEAAEALKGHRLDDDTLSRLDTAAQRACKPINDKRGTIEYRTKVAGVLARRAAAIAFERAAGRVAGVH